MAKAQKLDPCETIECTPVKKKKHIKTHSFSASSHIKW